MPDRHSAQETIRRLTEDANDALERLSGSRALNDGLVNLLALDAVAIAFGSKWEAKRDQVYEQVERVLNRVLTGAGYAIRVSEMDFLVVQPDAGPFAAQSLCYRSFREIWGHFLGEAPHVEVAVHRVTKLTAREISALPVDPQAAIKGEAQELAAAERASKVNLAGRLLSPERWTPFVATNGRTVRVRCALDKLVSVKSGSPMGYRLCREVLDDRTGEALTPAEVDGLSRADLFRIDMATLSQGVELIAAQAQTKRELSILAPLSYITLANTNSRSTFTAALEEANPLVRSGVICEIYGIAGVPSAALYQAISLIKPKCLLVVGHLVADDPPTNLRNSGVSALSVSAPDFDGDAQFIGWLRVWARTAKRVTKSLMVYECGTQRRIAIAGRLGASHCTLGILPNPDASRASDKAGLILTGAKLGVRQEEPPRQLQPGRLASP